MEELEDRLNKILKLYRQFQSDPNKQDAEEIELSIDLLKACIGDQFYALTFFSRIQREVTRWLDGKEMHAYEEECDECADFDRPTVDKIGRKLGIA